MDLMNSLLKHVFLYIQSKENSNISTTALDVLNSLLQIHSQIDIVNLVSFLFKINFHVSL